jgi:hypothetical protein
VSEFAELASDRRQRIQLLEWLLLGCVVLAGAITLSAGPQPDDAVAQANPFGLLYRKVIYGQITKTAGQGHNIPFWLILFVVAVVIGVQVAWPKVRAETRAMTAALGLFLMLAPVLNYAPQIERLKLIPADAAARFNQPVSVVTRSAEYNEFRPALPVSWPLGMAALLLVVWAFSTPPAAWPSSVKACGAVTVLFLVGGYWLVHEQLIARGHANNLTYTFWPNAIASVWTMAHCLILVTAAAAAGRTPSRSRVLGGAVVLLLLATIMVSRGAA